MSCSPSAHLLRGPSLRFALFALALAAPAPLRAQGAPSAAALPAPAAAQPAAPSTQYEEALLARALAETGLSPEPAPAGKIIERVEIFREDVIAPADPYPLLLAAVHARSIDALVRAELLIAPGEAWDEARIEETARNLRALPALAVVRTQACRATEPGRVILLVATKDLWSLRLNSALTVVGSVVQVLDLQPTEQNLFGAGKAASLHLRFQQLDLSSFTLRDKAALGFAFTDPRLFGSRWALTPALDLLIEGALPCGGRNADGSAWCPSRKGGSIDGLQGSIDLQRPLFSLATEWAFDLNASLNRRQVRRFVSGAGVALDTVSFDPEGTPAAQRIALPVVYNVAEYTGKAQVTRSFGSFYKLDLAAGAGAFRHLYTPPANFAFDRALVQQYVAGVLPLSEDDAYLFGSVRSRATRYVSLRNLQSFALTEDYLLGHDVTLELQAAENLQQGRQGYVSATLRSQYRWYERGDLLTLSGTAQTRWQPNLSETGHSGPFANTSLDLAVRNASPILLWGRLHTQVHLVVRWNDLNRTLAALGGDTGLRGYLTNSFLGSDLVLSNLEYRSEPWNLWSLHLGVVAFYDGGAVFSGRDPRDPTQPLALTWRQSVGAGVRLQFPQFDKQPLRIDLGVPLAAPAGTASWITFAYSQAF